MKCNYDNCRLHKKDQICPHALNDGYIGTRCALHPAELNHRNWILENTEVPEEFLQGFFDAAKGAGYGDNAEGYMKLFKAYQEWKIANELTTISWELRQISERM